MSSIYIRLGLPCAFIHPFYFPIKQVHYQHYTKSSSASPAHQVNYIVVPYVHQLRGLRLLARRTALVMITFQIYPCGVRLLIFQKKIIAKMSHLCPLHRWILSAYYNARFYAKITQINGNAAKSCWRLWSLISQRLLSIILRPVDWLSQDFFAHEFNNFGS